MGKDLLIVFFRIITILPLMLLVTKLMGRRSVAQLPVFDLLIIITLGSIVGADLAVPETPHTPTVLAVILVAAMQMLVAKWHIMNRRFGKLITFEPIIVIHQGEILDQNLKKIKYSVDDLLQMLRGKDIFNVTDVELAIMEGNGQLTVQKTQSKETVTNEDMGFIKTGSGLTYPVIIDGEIQKNVIDHLHISEKWVEEHLQLLGIEDIKNVFFASLTDQQQLHVSLKEDTLLLKRKVPPIFH